MVSMSFRAESESLHVSGCFFQSFRANARPIKRELKIRNVIKNSRICCTGVELGTAAWYGMARRMSTA